ncbi:hypothetical protein AAFF_G00059290 [Aldrovandia affinis]|uniref:Uncharacterized protein n=1 Tax=Aldrovandia affinis TaxID=143900 RepID=A0AAD7S2C6_9TELE|nr:hypothetical protein AAFF_G00059290 [Aldrovandia affinis]
MVSRQAECGAPFFRRLQWPPRGPGLWAGGLRLWRRSEGNGGREPPAGREPESVRNSGFAPRLHRYARWHVRSPKRGESAHGHTLTEPVLLCARTDTSGD